MQLVGTLGPATGLLLLGLGGSALDADTAQLIFIGALGLHAFTVSGCYVGVQDLSQKSASLISGAQGGLGVMAGAASQFVTGAILESNGRDFVPIFWLCAAVQLLGAAAFVGWWDSERRFE